MPEGLRKNLLTYWGNFFNVPESNLIALLRVELGEYYFDTTNCRCVAGFASDVLNETPMGQAKIALAGKNLQDEQVSLLEQISTAAGPVLGMCKKICGLTRAANGNGFRKRFPILDISNLPPLSMPECLGKAPRGIEQHVSSPRRNIVTSPQSVRVGRCSTIAAAHCYDAKAKQPAPFPVDSNSEIVP